MSTSLNVDDRTYVRVVIDNDDIHVPEGGMSTATRV
jgi:hypothetical protein